MTPDTPKGTRMAYVYHVYFAQRLASGRSADGDITLTLGEPLQYQSDLDQLRQLILGRFPGRSVVIKSWYLLAGKQRPRMISSRDGMNGPRVEGPLIDLDSPGPGGDSIPLWEPWQLSFRGGLNAWSGRIQFTDEVDRALSARALRQVGRRTGLTDLRYSPELQAQVGSMNAVLVERLELVRTALDRASAHEFAAETVEHLARFATQGLVPEATVRYLHSLAGALRHAEACHLSEEARP